MSWFKRTPHKNLEDKKYPKHTIYSPKQLKEEIDENQNKIINHRLELMMLKKKESI